MSPKEMTALVRRLLSDEQAQGFVGNIGGGNLEEPEDAGELLNYLDRAIDAYSEERAAKLDPRFLAAATFTNGGDVPEDFIAFAGQVPVEILGGRAWFYGTPAAMTIKYFKRLPHASKWAWEADMGFRLDESRRLCALAAIYALNKHEFNVSQDLALLGAGNADPGK
jgi:hypothetical protein